MSSEITATSNELRLCVHERGCAYEHVTAFVSCALKDVHVDVYVHIQEYDLQSTHSLLDAFNCA